MKSFEEIIQSPEQWNSEAFKEWKLELALSTSRVAAASGLSRATIRAIENGQDRSAKKPRRLSEKVIKGLRRAYEELTHKHDSLLLDISSKIAPPPHDLVKRHGKGLVDKTWHYFHWTRMPGGKQTLLSCKLHISPDGECTLNWDDLDHTYEGALRFEGRFDIMMMLDTSDALQERLVIRFKHQIHYEGIMQGAWFGVDLANR